jgi:hypothetical protein
MGDSDVTSWVITVGYALVAVNALRLVSAARAREASRNEVRPWWWIAGVCAALSINKQTDLQTHLVRHGRGAAIKVGWYEHRRAVGVGFLVAVGAVGISALFCWAVTHRKFVRTHPAMIGGAILVFFYCGLRSADIVHLRVVPWGEGDSETSKWIEAAGVALMLLGSRFKARVSGIGKAE